jgi:hypothetical protein
LADVLSLVEARLARRKRSLPYALNVQVGAVELILGSPADEDANQLHLSPQQAEELGHDLIRTARAAREAGPR